MIIQVTSGVGTGPNQLTAFDAALVTAGVADRNLIYLSSVLPPASIVEQVQQIACTPGVWGDRLYCVMARAGTAVPGTQAWAGVGWVQDASGRGLLVEHDADDETGLRALIQVSLDGLSRNRGRCFSCQGMVVAGLRCTGEPICAVAVAVFESAPWSTP